MTTARSTPTISRRSRREASIMGLFSNYSSERGQPTVPRCGRSSISLGFDGSLLSLRASHKVYSWSAVSGRADDSGKFKYSKERQREAGVGPVPSGRYWIDPAQLWERSSWNPFQSIFAPRAAWGDQRITIHIQPGTATFGRGGFFIHGGTMPGSAGCIDLTTNMAAFVRVLRQQVGQAANCYMALLVNYR